MTDLIVVEKNPLQEKLQKLKVFDWQIWSKEVSEFSWDYQQNETCLILEGEAEIKPKGEAESVKIQKGDLVVFKQGLRCDWKITSPIKKHYFFG